MKSGQERNTDSAGTTGPNDRGPDHGSDQRDPPGLQLTHAAVMTTDLKRAVTFYRDILGLSVRVVEDDPIRKGRRRAMLADTSGRDVVEIIEMSEMAHPSIPGRGGIHHVGFRLPRREWHSLRSRMDAASYRYEEVEGRLFVKDVDGLVLEIEQA
ncbi:MAG: VOC family protein [Rhodothermales bacterium]